MVLFRTSYEFILSKVLQITDLQASSIVNIRIVQYSVEASGRSTAKFSVISDHANADQVLSTIDIF